MEQDKFDTKRECKCAGKCGACQTLNLTYGAEWFRDDALLRRLRRLLDAETARHAGR